MTYEPIDGRLMVSVVIPAYFEEKTIGSIVERCLPFADEVLVVNDGSTDGTVKAARAEGARIMDLAENRGVLGATQVGLKEASSDIIVTLNADWQHDPAEVPGSSSQSWRERLTWLLGPALPSPTSARGS